MIEKLSMVKIGERKFPIKCNIDVLAAIQDEFENITEYEQKIIGLRPKKNADGIISPNSTDSAVQAHPNESIISSCGNIVKLL